MTGRTDWLGPVQLEILHNALTALGWRIIYVTWDDLRINLDAIVLQIRAALAL